MENPDVLSAETIYETNTMQQILKDRIIEVCNKNIASKGNEVGLSFYAFFKNKNDTPELLMEVATWWIKTQQLDHFESAVKIKNLVHGTATQ